MANVETIEATFPIRYLFRRRLVDSGGPGKFRGGAGGEMAIVAHDAPDGGIHYVLSGKGPKFPQSEGLAGGFPGAANDYIWIHGPKESRAADRFADKMENIAGDKEPISWGVFPLMGNDALYLRWNGGGGIGDPLERDPDKVFSDVTYGVISARAAKDVFGVVIDSNAVDISATSSRRDTLRQARAGAQGAAR
jgi:N-methylhydantoinase B